MSEVRRGLRVKLAEDPLEIRALVEVRQRVHGGSGVDVFDALTTSQHLLALEGTSVRGGARLTVDSAAGLPSDTDQDLRALLPAHAQLGAISRLCLEADEARSPRLLHGLISMSGYRARAAGLSHLTALVRAEHSGAMERIGFVPVSRTIETERGPRHPMVLDLHATSWEFADFVRRQGMGLWLDTFERAFFETGESIVVEGEVGDEAYLVVDGRAHAVDAAHPGTVLASFTHGDMFGELAMLTDRARATSVVAAVPTDVMVLRRGRFQRQVAASPDLAVGIMRSIGDRFHDLLVKPDG